MAVGNSPVEIENLKGAIGLGQQLLKSLELVNGGAAIAILTFYGNAVKDGAKLPLDVAWLKGALIAFGSGLALAMIAATCAYLGQLFVATSEPSELGKDLLAEAAHRSRAIKKSDRFLTAAVAIALLGLAAFVVGISCSAQALTVSPNRNACGERGAKFEDRNTGPAVDLRRRANTAVPKGTT